MLIRKIIVEQPENAVDYIEEYSRQLKKEYYSQETFFRDTYQPPIDIEFSLKWSKLLQTPPSHEKKFRADDDSIIKPIHPNVMELLHYLEQAGVNIPPHEMLCIGICINQFKEKVNANKIRYWGKIYGTRKNYFVLEVTVSEDDKEEIEADDHIEDDKDVETEEKENLDGSEVADLAHTAQIPTITPEGIFSKIKIPPIPKVSNVKTVVVPPEKPGYGVNSKVSS
ncbi:hypothetical protein J437_LFUL003576 [Ladona fulva]|uniref:Uncharacterized protein n=1 Tax=Ladona fulva TaxID=123851 RepID=A0A8K0JV37_LADFU|nr:hypothetical protein J437_LFUL003576 [Ladona fulva]